MHYDKDSESLRQGEPRHDAVAESEAVRSERLQVQDMDILGSVGPLFWRSH
jgi:hypothetical protein